MEKTGKEVKKLDSLPLRFGSFAESFVASEYECPYRSFCIGRFFLFLVLFLPHQNLRVQNSQPL
jgi:hypothetical protein